MTPDERILMLNRSLRCFAYGWLALVPLLGLAWVILGLRLFVITRAAVAGQWNPAAKYLNWGLTLSLVGSLLTLFCCVMLAVAWSQQE